MLRTLKRLMALSLGQDLPQLLHLTGLTWPRPCLERPAFLRFVGILGCWDESAATIPTTNPNGINSANADKNRQQTAARKAHVDSPAPMGCGGKAGMWGVQAAACLCPLHACTEYYVRSSIELLNFHWKSNMAVKRCLAVSSCRACRYKFLAPVAAAPPPAALATFTSCSRPNCVLGMFTQHLTK